jgi:hypothetical protein
MKLNQIKSNPNNPRIIKDEKFKKLCESIKALPKMMELRPIVVDENFIVQGGNMRLKALNELGYKEIPETWVKQAKDFTEEELKEFIIKDNVGFGEWDWDGLANNWDENELIGWGLNLPIWNDDMTNNESYEGLDALSKLDKFMNAEVKRMFLVYDNETFSKVVEWFNKLQGKYELQDNNQVILKLMENEKI